MAKNKAKKEKYYIAQGKDEPHPWIYKGTNPPSFYMNSANEHRSGAGGCLLIGSWDSGIIKPGEVKQLIIYAKDIK